MACLKGHLECVKVLLDGGASVFAIDDDGNTPVHYAFFGLVLIYFIKKQNIN